MSHINLFATFSYVPIVSPIVSISKLVRTSVRELEKTYAHVLDKFMKVELEGLRKHLKNSKIIAFPKVKSKAKSIS